ncbi:MAG: hypothetical protein NT027_06840, partial [Proteobacteria bacterium]|nr:hypothetical protein [Pseudomonadota bacterium]
KRFNEYKSDQRIEPIQLTLAQNDDQVLKIAERLAQSGKKLSLAHNLQQLIPGGEKLPGTDLFTVNLTKESLDLINRQSLDEFFARDHTELVINASSLKQDPKKLTELVKELQPYLTTTDLQTLKSKVSMNENIAVDEFLLPSFAKRMVTKHTIFKGPNCFHAALSFQNQNYPTSAQVNVREEAGYHRSMINYDELWRVVQSEFYEIDVSKVPLQYGDMILFFDVPKEAHTAVDFKTLRHAASYLFNGYIFQKGSKSANSPYVVRTLSDEWATWTNYTKNLGTKVFRRSSPNYRKASLWQSSDWLY